MTKVNVRFKAASLENFKAETLEQKKLVKTLYYGIENGFKSNIIIIGGVGTGKTHLAFAVLNRLAGRWTANSGQEYYRSDKVIYATIKEIIDNIKSSWKDPELSFMNDYCSVPLLIIDELGVQYGTPAERTELYEVFNRRYNDMLPIIAISNNSLIELQKILGQRIYDRLSGGAEIFELSGRSYRQEEVK